MRKAKKHLNLPVELITPEQKLEEISLFEDDRYSFLPLTNRQSKINGWINEESNSVRDQLNVSSLKSSIVIGKSISPPKQQVKNLISNKKILLINKPKQIQNLRLHSAELPSRKSMAQNVKASPEDSPIHTGTKMSFRFLRKKSGKCLSAKSKTKETKKYSIQGVNYPIFQSNISAYSHQKQYNPIMSKIRLLMKHRRHYSNNF